MTNFYSDKFFINRKLCIGVISKIAEGDGDIIKYKISKLDNCTTYVFIFITEPYKALLSPSKSYLSSSISDCYKMTLTVYYSYQSKVRS